MKFSQTKIDNFTLSCKLTFDVYGASGLQDKEEFSVEFWADNSKQKVDLDFKVHEQLAQHLSLELDQFIGQPIYRSISGRSRYIVSAINRR